MISDEDETRNERGPVRSRVDVDDARDIKYWCARFQCTERELRDAVTKVGALAKDVRMELDRVTGRR
jgi:hypothetical protein